MQRITHCTEIEGLAENRDGARQAPQTHVRIFNSDSNDELPARVVSDQLLTMKEHLCYVLFIGR